MPNATRLDHFVAALRNLCLRDARSKAGRSLELVEAIELLDLSNR